MRPHVSLLGCPGAPLRICSAPHHPPLPTGGPELELRAASRPTDADRAPTSQPHPDEQQRQQHADGHNGRPHGGGGASGGSARTEQAQRPLANLKGHCEQRADQPHRQGPHQRQPHPDEQQRQQHADRRPHGGGGASGGSARTKRAKRPLADLRGHCEQRAAQPTPTGPPASQPDPPDRQAEQHAGGRDGRPHSGAPASVCADRASSAASRGPEAHCKQRRDRGTCRHTTNTRPSTNSSKENSARRGAEGQPTDGQGDALRVHRAPQPG